MHGTAILRRPNPYLALPTPSVLMISLCLALVLSVRVEQFGVELCELGLANEGSSESLAVANPSNAVRGRHWLDWVGVHK